MKLCVVGTGYVGLVAGTCFADFGNNVICVDKDRDKIENLKKGILPIYEPGLEEMVLRNYNRKLLEFTTDLAEAIKKSDVIFIAVGTPGLDDSRPDISGVLAVAEEVGRHANGYKIVVNKSTVPVGMADMVKEAVGKNASHPVDLVSNPEFLREGMAIEDFIKPERVVIGTESEKAAEIMKDLYHPFVKESGNPIFTMSIKSAELSKYACNTFLSMKITYANIIANLCDDLGADYLDVKEVLGSDSRIGRKFLNAGIGYGGSCFPKDVRALTTIADDIGTSVPLIQEIENQNNVQKLRLHEKILNHYGKRNVAASDRPLGGLKFAVWGLAFKPGTDDMREAPSITLINRLLEDGAEIAANDPGAEKTARPFFQDRIGYGDVYEILKDRDALLILTEWSLYRKPDFERIRSLLKTPLIFDGRNIYTRRVMDEFKFTYYGIGTGNHY